jgi:hypothetical protein
MLPRQGGQQAKRKLPVLISMLGDFYQVRLGLRQCGVSKIEGKELLRRFLYPG